MDKPVRWLVVLLLLVSAAGCTTADNSPPSTAGGMSEGMMDSGEGVMLTTATATQTIDGTQVTLTMAPWPPETLVETSLTVTVQQGDQAVTGLQPVLDLTMPGMAMPENRPAAAEGKPGVYLAKTILTMGGRWQIDVPLDLPTGKTTVSFLLDARE